MSKKQSLTRAIALGLLLSTPFYEIAMAAPGVDSDSITENIVIDDTSATKTYTGDNASAATDTAGENGGNAGNITIDATLNKNISNEINITATAGNGGDASNNDDPAETASGNGGRGGDSTVSVVLASGTLNAQTADISITATGGVGGAGAIGGEKKIHTGSGGLGGAAQAYGLNLSSAQGTVITSDINIMATGGIGGAGGFNSDTYVNGSPGNGVSGVGGIGGHALAEAVHLSNSNAVAIQAAELDITAVGGKGGKGGSTYLTLGAGGLGGAADAYGLNILSSKGVVAASNINIVATGGQGGDAGSSFGNSGAAGIPGSDGGTATAYGVSVAGNSYITLTTDSIAVSAIGGTGGTGMRGGANGQRGNATAYGVYAQQGAVITLASDNNLLDIGLTVEGKDTSAYAVYVDQASVLFASAANLNKDAALTGTDNDIITHLNNATLGFADSAAGAKAVGRIITGGTLELAGSNTFRFATDLANNAADQMTFDSLAVNSTSDKQYITIAYDKSFDGSNLDSIIGNATVLHFDNLNGNDLTKFIAKESIVDNPLESIILTPTIDVSGGDISITKIDFVSAGPSESVMTAADAHMALGGIWRAETNNLMKRMGELRSDPDAAKGGVWARYYRGKQSANGAYERDFGQTYTGFQGGIDRAQAYKGGQLVTGLMVNRIDGTASYYAGNGEMSSTGLGLYASWLGNKGHYLDVIARASKLNNNFKLTDKSGNFASGDYSTWAYGISAEYGYRHKLQANWFIEPQAELTFSHINSSGYTMSNGLSVSNDAVNSAIGRIGFMTGKAFKANGRAGNAYIKASLLHEFGGKNGGRAYYLGRGLDIAGGDLGGTWYELGLGANLGLAHNANLYMDALKTFNGKLKTDWQFNAGVRLSF